MNRDNGFILLFHHAKRRIIKERRNALRLYMNYMIGILYSLHCAYISSGQMLHWISPMWAL